MSLHQSKRISVSTELKKFPHRGNRERGVGCFYRGQETSADPDHYLPFVECIQRRDDGLGRFVNRGRAFLRYDISKPLEAKEDKNFRGNRMSRMIDEPVMNEFVRGNRMAIAAVESWQ